MKPKREFLAITLLIFYICFRQALSVIHSHPPQNLANSKHPLHTSNALVPKASLTQKGYIQFLKYVVDVPELTDYTFCIWVRSNNLSHNHPLLSYSKHEEERLIRVWISPHGTHINLEIMGMPIFSIPVHIIENEWYHICQSWNSLHAAWSLYVNGKLQASGYAPKLKKLTIDSGGDMVVGQEYTDFDKGLDDGIEGDISGFNFVLASTFSNANLNKYPAKSPYAPNNLFKREIRPQNALFDDPFFANDKQFSQVMNLKTDAHSRGPIWKDSSDIISKRIPPLPLENEDAPPYPHQHQYPAISVIKTSYDPPISKGLSLRDYIDKPLGLLLVELSSDCGYLRGAPLSGKGVLVSWTKTDVRVFGGAILKTVPPFCVK